MNELMSFVSHYLAKLDEFSELDELYEIHAKLMSCES